MLLKSKLVDFFKCISTSFDIRNSHFNQQIIRWRYWWLITHAKYYSSNTIYLIFTFNNFFLFWNSDDFAAKDTICEHIVWWLRACLISKTFKTQVIHSRCKNREEKYKNFYWNADDRQAWKFLPKKKLNIMSERILLPFPFSSFLFCARLENELQKLL